MKIIVNKYQENPYSQITVPPGVCALFGVTPKSIQNSIDKAIIEEMIKSHENQS